MNTWRGTERVRGGQGETKGKREYEGEAEKHWRYLTRMLTSTETVLNCLFF